MHRLYIAFVLALRSLALHKKLVLATVLELIVGVSSVITMMAIAEGARLKARHDCATLPRELIAQAEAAERRFRVVAGSVAGIALLAGGTGIMAITLLAVSKRTREIGIRRALGARRRDIIAQFLIETTVVSCAGGLFGVLLGLAVTPVFSYLSGMAVVIRPSSPVVAFLVAVAIGVAFGVYPARRAAMLEPVEVLRAE
jgi:putative ABC transport system permease protein